jgi:hypothetical protein
MSGTSRAPNLRRTSSEANIRGRRSRAAFNDETEPTAMNAFRTSSRASASYAVPPTAVDVHAYVADNPFVSETTLEAWLRAGAVVRGSGSIIARDGGRYLLREAVRILGRRNGDVDPYGLTGRVSPLRELIREGAVISSDSVRIGPGVYDAEFGFMALRLGSADESGVNPAVR